MDPALDSGSRGPDSSPGQKETRMVMVEKIKMDLK